MITVTGGEGNCLIKQEKVLRVQTKAIVTKHHKGSYTLPDFVDFKTWILKRDANLRTKRK